LVKPIIGFLSLGQHVNRWT